MEVLTLHAAQQWAGAGSALLAAARRVAEASGARRLWLITTNDNVDALRFYQRRGYRLARVDAGAVDRSRAALKPAIPEVGAHGIPLRDELELELLLDDAPAPSSLPMRRRSSRSSSPWRVATRPRSPAATRPSSPPTSSRSARAAASGPAPRSSRRSTPSRRTRRSRSRPSRSPISGRTCVLASYDTLGITPDGEARRGRRSSIWVRQDDHWQLRFHQGTPISLDEDDGAR